MYIKQQIGKSGEDEAEEYLEKLNYKILSRNFRCKSGEIDIIAKDKKEVIFIEVKTRTTLVCGTPSESVNVNKKRHIREAAKYYLYKENLYNVFCRFDVIEIYFLNNVCEISHIKNVDIN